MNFDDLSDEIMIQIFSLLKEDETKNARTVNHRFYNLAQDVQVRMCRKIEADNNYQPTITNQELLSLVVDESGCAKHTPRRSALAILPSSCETHLGKLYQIKIAKKGHPDDHSTYPVWFIDNSATILVKHNGTVDLYATEKVAENDFQTPLTHLSLDNFLNGRSLHADSNENTTTTSMGI